MSTLTVRKLDIDLSQGFGRHWHRNAFLTQYFNALSMSFPVGEQSFIDAVRDAAKLLPTAADGSPLPEHAALQADVAQFIGQEATHRHLHAQYNVHLDKQGLVNRWQDWANARIAYGRKRNMHPLHWLAITVAYEHCTAVLADRTLRHPEWLEGAEPAMQTLWRWHAAEETEHRAVAFDLYKALGGNHAWRVRWYVYVLVLFTLDASRQTVLNLWRDGTLFKPSTWVDALRFFFGRKGAVWLCAKPLAAYFRRDFHPDHEIEPPAKPSAQDLASQWLKAHATRFRVIR